MVVRRVTRGSGGGSYDIAAEYTVAFGGEVPYNRSPIDAPCGASPCVRRPVVPLVTKKASPASRPARQAANAARPRHRSHSLAPEHIGEAGSVALLAMAILGLAIFIAAIAMIVFGLTTANRFGASPPPNVGDLGMGQILGGVGLVVTGVAMLGSALAVLADMRGGRLAAVAVSGLVALLSAGGVIRVMGEGSGDPVLAAALALTTVILGAAAIILVRRPA
jgi:hypothetical protein